MIEKSAPYQLCLEFDPEAAAERREWARTLEQWANSPEPPPPAPLPLPPGWEAVRYGVTKCEIIEGDIPYTKMVTVRRIMYGTHTVWASPVGLPIDYRTNRQGRRVIDWNPNEQIQNPYQMKNLRILED